MKIPVSAIQAINQNFRALESSALRLASLPAAGEVDIAQEMVLQLSLRHATAAQVSVIRTADEMLGELFDRRA